MELIARERLDPSLHAKVLIPDNALEEGVNKTHDHRRGDQLRPELCPLGNAARNDGGVGGGKGQQKEELDQVVAVFGGQLLGSHKEGVAISYAVTDHKINPSGYRKIHQDFDQRIDLVLFADRAQLQKSKTSAQGPPRKMLTSYQFSVPAYARISPMEAFFVSTGIVALAEMGDKTQIATVMLAAQYYAWFAVVAGTALGVMLANAPGGVARRRHHPARAAASGAPELCGYFCRARRDRVVWLGQLSGPLTRKLVFWRLPSPGVHRLYTRHMRRFEPDCGRRDQHGFEIQLNGVCFISQKPGPADCEAGFCFFTPEHIRC